MLWQRSIKLTLSEWMSFVTYLLYQNLVKAWIENGGETGIRTPEPVA